MRDRDAGGFPARTTAVGALARVLIFLGTYVVLLFAAGIALQVAAPGLLAADSAPDTVMAVLVNGGVSLVAALGAGWLLLALLDQRPARTLGFGLWRDAPAEAAGGLALGCVMLATVVLVMALAGWVAYRSAPGSTGGVVGAWIAGLAVLALPAASEEALFRGYGFQVLVDGLGPVPAVVVGSVIFAGAHAWNPDVSTVALVNIFLAGVLLSAAYLRRRSLWLSTGVHVGWNWAMASVAGLPVSGLTFLHTPMYAPVDRGPPWITGAGFGPEGGLAGTAAFLLGLALLHWVPAARHGVAGGDARDVAGRAARPAVDGSAGPGVVRGRRHEANEDVGGGKAGE